MVNLIGGFLEIRDSSLSLLISLYDSLSEMDICTTKNNSQPLFHSPTYTKKFIITSLSLPNNITISQGVKLSTKSSKFL